MLSSIFIALLQAVAGDPSAAPTETPATQATPAPEPAAAPRTERRRVCHEYPAATGGRLPTRRCRMEEVRVETPEPDESAAAAPQTGGAGPSIALAPTPQ